MAICARIMRFMARAPLPRVNYSRWLSQMMMRIAILIFIFFQLHVLRIEILRYFHCVEHPPRLIFTILGDDILQEISEDMKLFMTEQHCIAEMMRWNLFTIGRSLFGIFISVFMMLVLWMHFRCPLMRGIFLIYGSIYFVLDAMNYVPPVDPKSPHASSTYAFYFLSVLIFCYAMLAFYDRFCVLVQIDELSDENSDNFRHSLENRPARFRNPSHEHIH